MRFARRILLGSVVTMCLTAAMNKVNAQAPVEAAMPLTTASALTPSQATIESSATTTLCQTGVAPDKKLGGQLFFRFGGGFSNNNRSGDVFTDTGAAAGLTNDGTSGVAVGFGFQLPLMKDPVFGNTVLGEVLMDYTQASNKAVVVTTSALLGAPRIENVRVNNLAVVGSPKYRFDGFGDIRPWVAPVGLGFYVNSPPTNNTGYLDVGLHYAVGVDYRLTKNVSLGVDCRYHMLMTRSGGWLTAGTYIGFDY